MTTQKPEFFENLEPSYRALERALNTAKVEVLKKYGKIAEQLGDHDLSLGIPDDTDVGEYIQDEFLIVPATYHDPDGTDYGPAKRAVVRIGKGHLAKVVVRNRVTNLRLDHPCYGILPRTIIPNRFEERNVKVLRSRGFTRENGFFVPEHKVVGVHLVDGAAKVDSDGEGWVIVEDASENGAYNVSDIEPYHFAILDNRAEVFESYIYHVNELLSLCRDTSLKVGFHKHGRAEEPVEPLSRMLLLKERDGMGDIVIGDLDILEFAEK